MKTSAIFLLIAIAINLNLNAANNMGEPNYNTIATAYLPAAFDIVEEDAMDVSEWMFDVDAFESSVEIIEISDWMLDVEAFGESTVMAEDWMFDESLMDEHEDMIEIDETWMLNVDAFRNLESDFNEDYVEVEDWMLSTELF